MIARHRLKRGFDDAACRFARSIATEFFAVPAFRLAAIRAGLWIHSETYKLAIGVAISRGGARAIIRRKSSMGSIADRIKDIGPKPQSLNFESARRITQITALWPGAGAICN